MILLIKHVAMVGRVFAGLRGSLGMTQSQVAQSAGIAMAQLSRQETARVTPDLDTTVRVLRALGWQLCALPQEVAETHDEREAVVRAALETDFSALTATLATAVDNLRAAQESAPGPRSPVRQLEHLTQQLSAARAEIKSWRALGRLVADAAAAVPERSDG